MLWQDNQPIGCTEIDVFGGGRVFQTLRPFLEAEGIRIGNIYDDAGTYGPAWDAAAYAARPSRPPMLFCVGNQAKVPQSMTMRGQKFQQLVASGVRFVTYVSPQALVSPGCRIGNGAIVMPTAFLHCQVQIGDGVYVNVGVLVSHHGRVADNVVFGPRVTLASSVTVESGTFIGVGATVIDGVSIGFGSLVAAGAVVTSNVPAQVMVAGVPAQVKKSLAGEMR